ncbi:hypothetical protein [Extensimonas perlucida]|uniref:hypothetical protein n=1 Tax=Extensimonas perlucida TaxID=2590786 RepID=UPI0011AA2764|nr:hypothetical protein [Extensimonas perlucida]
MSAHLMLQHAAIAVAICALFFVLRKWVWLYALVVFPGTLAHELSHFFVGLVLGARPASFNPFPKRAGNAIMLGEVRFERLRWWNAIPVALAPLSLVPLSAMVLHESTRAPLVSAIDIALKIVAAQFLFASKPSAKDCEHAIAGAGTLIVLAATAFVCGM